MTIEVVSEEEKNAIEDIPVDDYEYIDFDMDLDFSLNVSANAKKKVNEITEKSKQKIQEGKQKAVSVQQAVNERPQYVKLKDKIAFVVGVSNISLTSFVMGKLPELYPLFYTFKAVTLLGARFITYKQNKWHYFLLDFCYFANFLLLAYLHLFPDYPQLFAVCFTFSNGPLLWAIVAWRNSMVFHSFDKITSIFIHLSPPLLTYTMRWFYHDPKYVICPNEECEFSFVEMSLYPLIPYLIWQVLYVLKVEIISAKKVSQQNYMTSLKYLGSDPRTLIGRILFLVNSFCNLSKFKNLNSNFQTTKLTAIASFLPIKLFFDNFWLHTAFLEGITLVCMYNGGVFYIEVFSKRYQDGLKKLEEKLNSKND